MKKISFHTSNHFFDSDRIVRPKRDWKILVTFFAGMIFVALCFDIFFYQKIASGSMYISVNKDTLTIENLKSAELESIIDQFQAKETKAAGLKLGHVVDPSL